MTCRVICVWALGLAVACGPGADGSQEAASPEQGVATLVRDLAGDRIPEAEVLGGGSRSIPDASGHLVFNDELPGLFAVSAEAPDYVRSGTGAPVVVGRLTAAELWLAPAERVAGAASLQGAYFELTIPEGVLVDELVVPYEGDWEFVHAMLEGDARWSTPGESLLLYDDILVKPLQPHHPVYLQGFAGEERLDFEGFAQLSLTLPEGSPVQTGWRAYHYAMGAQRWVRGEEVVVSDGQLEVPIRSMGWVAFGEEDQLRGCVQGTVVTADGAYANGAEVRLLEPGTIGATRAYVDEGRFCLPLGVGVEGAVQALWYAADHSTMGRGSGVVRHEGSVPDACGGTCFDVGEIVLEMGVDRDGDHYFSGPGGDCDDADADVNPSVVYGDGSWCAP